MTRKQLKLFTWQKKARFFDVRWTPAGKNLVYIKKNVEFGNNTLRLQPINGKNPRMLAHLGIEEIAENSGLAISPDGKTAAVAQGGWRHNAVLLK